MAKNVYEKALETYSSGRFLQLEGSFGRAFGRAPSEGVFATESRTRHTPQRVKFR